jgi:hypothetical protein
MTSGQVIVLEHSVALADHQMATVESGLQGTFGWLATSPEMVFRLQVIIFDIGDAQRTVFFDAVHDRSQFVRLDRRKPANRLSPMSLHRRDKEPKISDRYVAECVRPVFEDRFADRLSMRQVLTGIRRNAIEQNVMVASFDDVDRVNLHIAQLFNGLTNCCRPIAERIPSTESLRMQPNGARPFRGNNDR